MRWYQDMGVTKKLTMGFGLMVALLAVVGLLGLSAASSSNAAFDVSFHRDVSGIESAYRVSLGVVRMGRLYRTGMLEPDARDEVLRQIEPLVRETQFDLDEAARTVAVEANRARIVSLKELIPEFAALATECVRTSATDMPKALELTKRASALAAKIQSELDDIVQVKSGVASRAYEESAAQYARNRLLVMVVLGLSLLSALGAVMLIGGNIRKTLAEVELVSVEVSSAAQQLTAASEQISSGAQEQASSLEETAASLEEVSSTVKQNADNAHQASQLASSARDSAERGGKVVDSAVTAMVEITRSSKRIADIITTIDEIAFQTNLLALNAAVEAARAGEQGRGFAVVAAEVRTLAQRSGGAAKEIRTLINDALVKVEAGATQINQSGVTLEEIVRGVKRLTDMVSEIAAASSEQSTGLQQINTAVTQVDQVTQANASQTEELSGTSESLSNKASELSNLIRVFQHGRGAAQSGRYLAEPARRAPAVARGLKMATGATAASRSSGTRPTAPPVKRAANGYEEF
jgi:methyl-accepting chemotaxis protein